MLNANKSLLVYLPMPYIGDISVLQVLIMHVTSGALCEKDCPYSTDKEVGEGITSLHAD